MTKRQKTGETHETPLRTYHLHGGNKFQNWTLEPGKKILIMGDSNLNKLPHIHDKNIQIDCYPGARLTHTAHIIKHRTPTNPTVSKVILSFGINDRETSDFNLLKRTLETLWEVAQQTFPNAIIYMPLIMIKTSP